MHPRADKEEKQKSDPLTSIKGAAGKKNCKKLFLTEICFQFSSGFAGKNQVLRLRIRKTQCDWID